MSKYVFNIEQDRVDQIPETTSEALERATAHAALEVGRTQERYLELANSVLVDFKGLVMGLSADKQDSYAEHIAIVEALLRYGGLAGAKLRLKKVRALVASEDQPLIDAITAKIDAALGSL